MGDFWGNTTNEYASRAARHQHAVTHDEREGLGTYGLGMDGPYTREGVAQATVHVRQDVVALVSLTVDLNLQLRIVRRLMWAILAVLVYMAYRSS